MTFEEFYKIPNNKKMIEILSTQMYFSNRGFFLRKHMEQDEFTNEVILRLIKYWNYFQTTFKGSSNTFVGNVVNRTVSKIYEEMNAQKRQLNYNDNVVRIDKEKEEDEKEIVIVDNSHTSFNEDMLIKLVVDKIDNQLDKKVCVMFLQGITQKRISEITGYTKRQVEHRINSKYRPLFIETYKEYKNNLVV